MKISIKKVNIMKMISLISMMCRLNLIWLVFINFKNKGCNIALCQCFSLNPIDPIVPFDSFKPFNCLISI